MREWIQDTFQSLQTDGMLGDPHGRLAFAYLRVSTSDQAEEGRSGLPRQLQHIHAIARQEHLAIPFSHVYVDDSSGFEFQTRVALTQLRQQYTTPHNAVRYLVIEHLDRLSRHADWHQGFLLDELAQAHVQLVAWKTFQSRIERVVMGAIAQDSMEQAQQRMIEGREFKARSGRVTSTHAAYGYKFVNQHGQDTHTAGRDTYYAIHEPEAAVVRRVFEFIANGTSTRSLAYAFQQEGVKPPKRYQVWTPDILSAFVKNELYKGNFYANRLKRVKVQKLEKDGYTTREFSKLIQRPRDEWIHVPVPPLVSDALWEAANQMLIQNRVTSARNRQYPYLLTGLIQCASCGCKYAGYRTRKRNRWYMFYVCNFNKRYPASVYPEKPRCLNSRIYASQMDDAVWRVVSQALLQPEWLTAAIDHDTASDQNQVVLQQIAYLEREEAAKHAEEAKLYKAYLADVFDADEYKTRRQLLKLDITRLAQERERLQSTLVLPDTVAARKQLLLDVAAQLRAQPWVLDPPFEIKQRIIRLVVDIVVLDTRTQTITVQGIVRGTHSLKSWMGDMSPSENDVVNTSSKRRIHNLESQSETAPLRFSIQYDLQAQVFMGVTLRTAP